MASNCTSSVTNDAGIWANSAVPVSVVVHSLLANWDWETSCSTSFTWVASSLFALISCDGVTTR